MSDLLDVSAAVSSAPGSTVAALRNRLRAAGRVSITAADVQRELARWPARFSADRNEPPRWWPAGLAPPCPMTEPEPESEPAAERLPPLYAWQHEALAAWRENGCRGVVEAVTGTGKTMLGVSAIGDELLRGGQAVVLVPTCDLAEQWEATLRRLLRKGTSVGLLGGGRHGTLGAHDVLIAVVNSAREADLKARRPGGLLVGDECHRYGSDANQLALRASFPRRLGLSATYARADDGGARWLDPYFGGTCFRMGYARAIGDGVIARFTVTLLGVAFSPEEYAEYDRLSDDMASTRARLIASGQVPADPIGEFMAAVSRLARSSGGSDSSLANVARAHLYALSERRRLLAETPAKSAALEALVPTVSSATRTIVFTQSIAAAERAAAVLATHGLRAEAIHSRLGRLERREVLARFASGDLEVLSAPQVLDEGIDVPAADLAIILAASRSRRQMIQRMGRVLRRKPDGRRAQFVVVSVNGTVEDPALGAHETFLDEITNVADDIRQL